MGTPSSRALSGTRLGSDPSLARPAHGTGSRGRRDDQRRDDPGRRRAAAARADRHRRGTGGRSRPVGTGAAAGLRPQGRLARPRPSAAAGLLSAIFVTPYPPGFPVLVPGQEFSKDILDFMDALDAKEIHGFDPVRGYRVFAEPGAGTSGASGASTA
ncbi:hypothetical protein ABTX77_17530 [Streptomyces sp. NPDC097704]|uniref:Orn/Lys/Arg family decarboxylase n=1 Tax=Streptomyces sp. NPDC097704 TaxID=3157101 RepID=UPI0033313BF3